MSFRVIVVLLCILSSVVYAETPITLGNRYTLSSEILTEERRISVYLPRSYDRSSEKTYDVLYLLDGGVNLFHTVGTQYFLAGYHQMPELIIIGIHNTVRNRDFTPSQIDKVLHSGGADNFRDFIEKELFSFVEKKFRTSKRRYLSGHSYGGLFAIDTLVKKPEMFNAYFTFSPSLRWDDDLVLNSLVEKVKNKRLNSYLYLNIGDEGFKLRRPVLKLHETLKAQDDNSLRWKIDWLDDENHSTTPIIGQFLAFRDYFSKK